MWQKEKLHVLCNFFFCHYVFKKLSAAEASERVKINIYILYFHSFYSKWITLKILYANFLDDVDKYDDDDDDDERIRREKNGIILQMK